MNGSALVDLILINKEELVWDVKLSDSFAWSDHEMVDVRILGVGKREKVGSQPWTSGENNLAYQLTCLEEGAIKPGNLFQA